MGQGKARDRARQLGKTMRIPLLAMLALTLSLGACQRVSESRFNPFNWFGRSEARAVQSATAVAARPDPRPLVDQVTQMAVEPIPGGAILRASGLPPTQGHWDAELVQVSTADIPENTLVFDFRLSPPPYAARQGTEPSRRVEVATYLTDNDLAGIRSIVVRGARTERVTRR